MKPEQTPAIVIFFFVAITFHFFALKNTVINNNIPKIIKKLFVPIVKVINGIEIKVPITLPENEYARSSVIMSFKLRKALLNAKNVPIKTMQLGTIVGSKITKKHAGIPKPIPMAL